MSETEALLRRAERYLRSAELLIADGDYESAVSRTYYAMFFAAEAALMTSGLSFSSHKGVISAFGRHFVKTQRVDGEHGRQLHRAFAKRQLSDYVHTFVIGADEAGELLITGRAFVATIGERLTEWSVDPSKT